MSWYARIDGWKPGGDDAREAGDIDYARIVHSASFRRLQGKTQILNLGDSDFYRTRLTHSLEVAQIAGSLVRQLRKDFSDDEAIAYLPDPGMIQAIGSTHDLGHPPFGHGGEVALNYCMRRHGGFEGNGQTLRILARLEKFSKASGANLSRRTLLGVLKYPVPYSRVYNAELEPRLVGEPSTIRIIDREVSKPPKCYLDCEQDIVDWILAPLSTRDRETFGAFKARAGKHALALHKSFDCSIMDLADDISFGVHDLEDAIALGLVSEKQFRASITEEDCASFLTYLKERYRDESGNNVYETLVTQLFAGGRERKHAVNRMVGHLVKGCRIEMLDVFAEPLLRYRLRLNDGPARFVEALKRAVYDLVIRSPEVRHLEFKGQRMVVAVFEAIMSEPDALLPRDTMQRFRASREPERTVCDYIAGMTDSYLLKTYDRLFSPRMGSVFDRL